MKRVKKKSGKRRENVVKKEKEISTLATWIRSYGSASPCFSPLSFLFRTLALFNNAIPIYLFSLHSSSPSFPEFLYSLSLFFFVYLLSLPLTLCYLFFFLSLFLCPLTLPDCDTILLLNCELSC